jgi:hypothetical protein
MENAAAAGGLMALLGGMLLVLAIPLILMIVAMVKIFSKAGKPGWHSIIPILNGWQMCVIAGKPGWWSIVMVLVGVIPIVGAIVSLVMVVMVCNGLSKNFGKGTGFTVGLVLLGPIFMLILAFGSAQYIGQGGGGAEALASEPAPEPESSEPEQSTPSSQV